MKIAIPTNDGLTICPDFGQARGFLILTLELGEIIHEEIRWKKDDVIQGSGTDSLALVQDCRSVLVNETGTVPAYLLAGEKTEIIRTGESFITNAYIHYLENTLRREANTCCCP